MAAVAGIQLYKSPENLSPGESSQPNWYNGVADRQGAPLPLSSNPIIIPAAPPKMPVAVLGKGRSWNFSVYQPKANFKLSTPTTHEIGQMEIRADLNVKAYPRAGLPLSKRVPPGRNFALPGQRGILYFPAKMNAQTQVIVMVNGLNGRSEASDCFVKLLAEQHNFIVLVIDLPGHGESETPPLYNSKSGQGFQYNNPLEHAAVLRAWRDTIIALFQSPAAQLLGLSVVQEQEPYFIGYSLGGGLVETYHALYEDVPGVYSSSGWNRPIFKSRLANWFPKIAEKLFREGFDEENIIEISAQLNESWGPRSEEYMSQEDFKQLRLILKQYDPQADPDFVDITLAEVGMRWDWVQPLLHSAAVKARWKEGRNGIGMGLDDPTIPNRRTERQAKRHGCKVDSYGTEKNPALHYTIYEYPEELAENVAKVFHGEEDRCW